jgi:hypothetical protein
MMATKPYPMSCGPAAAAVAGRDGINRTAAALHLDGGKLKRRMAGNGEGSVSRKERPPAFIELTSPLDYPTGAMAISTSGSRE